MKKKRKIKNYIIIAITMCFVFVLLVIFITNNSQKEIALNMSDWNSTDSNVNEIDYQNYWATTNHNFCKAENGYYFMGERCNSLCYWDSKSKKAMLLCGKPDCLHDNDKCNAYLGKGDYLPFTLYYYDHFLYALKMGSSGNAVLVQISEDGTSRKEICELLPAYRSNNIDLSFHDGKVYAYSHVMETRASEKTNTEYDALILCADLSTGKVETAHTYRGLNAVIQKGRCYSNKYLFIAQKMDKKIEEHTSATKMLKSDGIYALDYKTNEAELLLSGDIYDYAVDEDNQELYYFLSGKGLYKTSFSGEDSRCIWKSDKYSEKCTISFDGKYIFLNNANWVSTLDEDSRSKYLKITVIDTEGNKVDELPGRVVSYFGDEDFLFANQISDSNPSGFEYIDKNELGNHPEWKPISDKSLAIELSYK